MFTSPLKPIDLYVYLLYEKYNQFFSRARLKITLPEYINQYSRERFDFDIENTQSHSYPVLEHAVFVNITL